MTKIVFAGKKSDALVSIALGILKQYPYCVEICYLEEGELAPAGSYVIFTSGGNFPSRFIREVQSSDMENRSIKTPKYAESATKAFALNLARTALILERHPNFVAALTGLHSRLNPRAKTAEAKRIKSRAEWPSGFHARRRNGEDRDVYALQ